MGSPSLPHLRGLDGLRALAIGLTLWMHLEMNGWTQSGLPLVLGRQGVSLFFVLSGYLITRILLSQESLKRFYWRRAWRIFPPYYTYLAVVGVLWGLGTYRLRPVPFLAAATYWSNAYHSARGFPLEHTWSVAVEEQFYLLWPILLNWLGPRLCRWSIPAVFAIWPLQRWLRTGAFGHPSSQEAFFSSTYDLLLWGSLGALLPCRYRPQRGIWAVTAVLCLVGLAAATDQIPAVLIPPLRGLSLMLLILWLIERPGSLAVRVLEHPLLRWLGTRSYSLYLWHILFCDPRLLQHWNWPFTVILSLICAELSYRLIELPARRARDYRPNGACSSQD